MEAQEIRYRVNKKVFRQASLYAMFLRNRNTFRVGIAVVLAAHEDYVKKLSREWGKEVR